MAWPYQRVKTGPRQPATRPIRRDLLTALALVRLGRYERLIVTKILLGTDQELTQAVLLKPTEVARECGCRINPVYDGLYRLQKRNIIRPFGEIRGFYTLNRDIDSWVTPSGQPALSIAEANYVHSEL